MRLPDMDGLEILSVVAILCFSSSVSFGSSGSETLPSLIQALNEKNQPRLILAIQAVGRLGPSASGAVFPLLKTVTIEQDGVSFLWIADVRNAIATTICQIGEAGVPSLLLGLKNNDNRVRSMAAIGLAVVAPEVARKKANPILLKDLRHRQIRRQREAVLALGDMGPAAKPAVPGLLKALERARRAQRGSVEKFKSEDYEYLRAEVVEALGKIRLANNETVGALIEELKPTASFSNSDVPVYAEEALVSMGAGAVPKLTQALHNDDDVLRSRIARILRKMGPPAKQRINGCVRP